MADEPTPPGEDQDTEKADSGDGQQESTPEPSSPEKRAPEKSSPEKRPEEDAEEKFARRAFFVEGFRNLLKPVASAVEKRLDHVKESIELSQRNLSSTGAESGSDTRGYGYYGDDFDSDRLLRPPGALEEELFLERCSREGQCVAACPVQAIQFLTSDDPAKDGTPYIDPQVQACVVCDDLACMQVCPSGALQKIPRHLIHMGVAELRRDYCLRSDGEDCQICVEKCPLGSDAIEIPYHGADVDVKTDGCIGCGVCEMYCPTEPKAIVIKEG